VDGGEISVLGSECSDDLTTFALLCFAAEFVRGDFVRIDLAGADGGGVPVTVEADVLDGAS
jgi:hypothetical protein